MIVPVILSGGSGTRLWPLSRELYPKQLIALLGEQTLLQQTITRISDIDDTTTPLVICNQEHRFLVAEQMREVGQDNLDILLEPFGRNTAPAIALAAIHSLQKGQDPILVVMPADHIITDNKAFDAYIKKGLEFAEQGKLITFGITPTAPATGFGYIHASQAISEHVAYGVDKFVEKPDKQRAQQYIDDGNYYWNSGIFMFKASAIISELEQHAPDIINCCQDSLANFVSDLDFIRLKPDNFYNCPNDSIDYTVMEKTENAIVIPMDITWSDVGSWHSLWEITPKDNDNNVIIGDVITQNTKNCYIQADNRLIAAVGLNNQIVVETADAVLIAEHTANQDIKTLVKQLKSMSRSEVVHHCQVHRPWGSYESLASGPGFQVKHIKVNPGASLSLQLHNHRSEHWVVVSGEATVTKDDDVFVLKRNESTYIPKKTKHRLCNNGDNTLDLIEIQTGAYLGEDDIIRFEDDFGRA